jgi:alpha-L-fucosidase
LGSEELIVQGEGLMTKTVCETIPVPEPRISRFEELGFGMFIHWGLYSQLGQGEWIQRLHNITCDEYNRLFDTFTAEDFDARKIARTARQAGMRYITLTTRHHEGFSLYDTHGLSDFDAPHSPAGRDLIAEFAEACRAESIVPFFYHTTLDWHWRGQKTPDLDPQTFNDYLDYLHDSVEVLCRHYGKIGGLWFDGNWSCPAADWKLDRLYRMIRKNQPDAIIVNNTGIRRPGEIGHPEIDSVTFENQAGKPLDRRGHAKYIAGEICQTMNAHWGIGANDLTFKSPRELIEKLAQARKVGANYLLNIGPSAQGAIPDYEAACLAKVGHWAVMAQSVLYRGRPVAATCQGRDFLLEADGKWYCFVHDLGIAGGHADVTLAVGGNGPRSMVGLTQPVRRVSWLDNGEELRCIQDAGSGMAAINFTGYPYGVNWVVRIAQIEFE